MTQLVVSNKLNEHETLEYISKKVRVGEFVKIGEKCFQRVFPSFASNKSKWHEYKNVINPKHVSVVMIDEDGDEVSIISHYKVTYK